MEFRKERARRVHQRNHKLKGEASRLLNTLEVETVQRKEQREGINIEGYVKLCQVGIERVQRVHEKNSVSSSEVREVSEEDTYRVVKYSIGSTRCA
jgi:hypothetical protein